MKTKLILLLLLPALNFNAAEYDREAAERVAAFLERISGPPSPSPFLREVTFSENECNSYLNLIHIPLNLPEVKHIGLAFAPENTISGEIQLDLQGNSYRLIPAGLRKATIEFSGIFECSNYLGRFLLRELRVNGASFSPHLLDELMQTVQLGQAEKKSLFDWYPLLPGLKQIRTDRGSVSLLY